MAPLFKSGSELMEQALDLSRRRDFARARQKFLDAGVRFSKEGSIHFVNLANAYAEIMRVAEGHTDPATLTGLAAHLRSSVGGAELRPGPRGISANDLATQLEVTASDASLMQSVNSGAGDRSAIAKSLQSLANDYRRLGDQVLFVPELLQQRSVPAESRVPVLMAMSFEILGGAAQTTNPLQAAEYFQTAQQYWTQAGSDDKARENATRVENLAFTAKCWFCGREGTGHGIQFVSLPIDQDVAGLKGLDTAPLPSLDRSGRLVFVCKGCHSAVYGLADRLAMQRAGEAEVRLDARIRALEQRLNRMPGPAGVR